MARAHERQGVEPAACGLLGRPQLRPAGQGSGVQDDGAGVATVDARFGPGCRDDDGGARGQGAGDAVGGGRLEDGGVREGACDFLGGA